MLLTIITYNKTVALNQINATVYHNLYSLFNFYNPHDYLITAFADTRGFNVFILSTIKILYDVASDMSRALDVKSIPPFVIVASVTETPTNES